MKTWHWMIALVLTLPPLGCRSHGNHELLEREMRWQEDRIDELERQLGEVEQQRASCQRENEALLGEAGGGAKSVSEPSSGERSPEHDLTSPPDVILPDADKAPPPGELPEPEPPAGPRMEPSGPGGPDSLPTVPEGETGSAGSGVVRITLNRQLTGGHNVDRRPGDEGVLVVVEPRDATGKILQARGDVAVVVLDPAESGQAARVARWNFTAKEAAARFRRTPLGTGMHFALRWPRAAPVHRQLNLYVRFTTADGRKLLAEKPIDVDLPGQQARRWTTAPEPARLSAAAASQIPSAASASPSGTVPVEEAHEEAAPAAQSTREHPPKRRADGREPLSERHAPAWSPYR